jgi:stage V sporulation protein S
MTTNITETLIAAATTKPVSLAGAINGIVRVGRRVEIHAVGAGALNQAVKAIAIARGYLAPSGIDICCIPSFMDIEIGGEERTGLRLVVEVRE